MSEIYFLAIFEGEKLERKISAGFVLSEVSLLVLYMALFSHDSTWSSLLFIINKDSNLHRLGLTCMTSF